MSNATSNVSAEQVRELREKTGAGLMDCKKALVEASGDATAAIEWLRKKGMASAEKKAGRATKEGSVASYIHAGGKVGVLIEVACETDFVARTEQFQTFVKDMAMHVAAANPLWVSSADVPADVVTKEKEIAIAQMKDSGKPAAVLEKIAEGKLNKFYSETCMLDQPFIRDGDKKVSDVLKGTIGALGENMMIRRFSRFVLGEDLGNQSKES